ncbi:neprilysin-2-like [Diorhabda carinulata]|uniref:neprilysin-2-like n=1 Tax=Diorhabda carinulata TaxID=1163345 RepID=UPI0025A1F852|nr:neprilysin-2-like [Diorhabda carinulata]
MDEKLPKRRWKEKRNTFYVVMIVTLVIVLSGVIVVLKLRKIYRDNICLSADCVNSSEYFLDIINNSINPCDNFYEFACGGYQETTSTLAESQKRVLHELELFTLGAIKADDAKSIKIQKKYYKTCMNTLAIEEDDNQSIKKIYEQLGGWPILSLEWINSYNLEKITKQCAEMGLFYNWFFEIDTYQRSLTDTEHLLRILPPTNTNFIKHIHKTNYQVLIQNVVKRLGSNRALDEIADASRKIVEFENSLAQIISESTAHITNKTVSDLKREFPNIPWASLFTNVVIETNASIEVSSLYFSKLIRLLEQTSISTKANYIFWKITQFLYPFLSRDIRREFEAYENVINNSQPSRRSDFCSDMIQTVFAYVSEAAYARKYSAERESINEIVNNIKHILQDHINESKWMNQNHKTYALDKLRNIKVFIGAPDEVFDEKKFDNLLGVDEINILDFNNTLDIVRTVDKSRDKYNLNLTRQKISYQQGELYRDIVTIEAKYLPKENLIYIPAAIIGGVFDSHKGLNFRNYSVLGTIIAHEFTHAFGIVDTFMHTTEKEIRKWSNETYQSFSKNTECLLEECLQFDLKGSINETCNKLFDENFADYASVDISYEAFRKQKAESINQLPGLKYNSNQLFWLSYAGTMCNGNTNATTLIRRHLNPAFRILGSFRNSRHFAKDFNCKSGTYMNPVDKCIVL